MSSAPSGGMHNLTTLLKRLEAVTSRLEDVAVHHASGAQAPHLSPRSPTTSTTGSVPNPAVPSDRDMAAGVPPPPPPPPTAPTAAQGSREADAYQELIDGAAQDFLSKAQAIGGMVAEHSALVTPLLQAQKSFVALASAHSQPGQKDFGELLGPQGQAIQAIVEAKDKLGRTKDGREWGACLSVVAEGIPAWGWVQVEKTPAPYVLEMKNASQFWVDRVQKQFKETKPEVVAWAKSYTALIDALHAYVKQYHTTGVKWNPKGPPASASALTSSAPSAPAAPTAPAASKSAPTASAGAGGQSALLAALNRGGDITSGLKKVDKSQMTHKNPELRQSSAVPASASGTDKKSPPEIKAKPGALVRGNSVVQKKPAKTELEGGNKWSVEYHEDNKEISITETDLSHVVHIFACHRSVIRISGKINAVTLVNCKKTAVILESTVSSLSITSSPGFEVQITGTVPTIQIDNTDGGQVYLSEACMGVVEVITSKTSGLNISVPTGEGGDWEERAVPEQMKSVVRGGKLVTEIVEHAG